MSWGKTHSKRQSSSQLKTVLKKMCYIVRCWFVTLSVSKASFLLCFPFITGLTRPLKEGFTLYSRKSRSPGFALFMKHSVKKARKSVFENFGRPYNPGFISAKPKYHPKHNLFGLTSALLNQGLLRYASNFLQLALPKGWPPIIKNVYFRALPK